MSQQSFHGLGVSQPVVDALAARSIDEPFSIQSLVLPDALAGLDVLAKSPTGSGQDPRLRVADRRALEPRDGQPSALVLVPTRARAAGHRRAVHRREAEGPPHRRGLRRRAAPGQAAKAREGARRRRHARPARGPRAAAAVDPRPHPDPRPRRGRPDARHGLQAAGGQARSPGAQQPPDDVLLGDARRGGWHPRPRLHVQPVALRSRAACRAVLRRDRAPLRLGRPEHEGRRPSSSCWPEHRARRWSSSARSAAPTDWSSASLARGVKAESLHGDMSQSSRRSARSTASSRAGCPCSWRPMWPRAASTSTTSST